MKLHEKGRYGRPSKPRRHARAPSERRATWPNVLARTHWRLGDEQVVDGADFYLGDAELGHIHLDGEAHVAVGRKLAAAIVRRGLASAFRWSRDFVTTPVDSPASVTHTAWLFQLRHDALSGISEPRLLARVDAHATPTELAALEG